MRARGAVIAGIAAGAVVLSLGSASVAQADDQGLWQRDTLTGDWGGARTDMSSHGVSVDLNYIGEMLGNLSGGIKRGWSYEGRATLAVDLDLEKLLGWSDGSAYASVYQIHHIDGMPGADYVGSIGDVSNIEARHSTRLFTAWFEQHLFDDKLSLRAGQLAADDEFLLSPTAGNLINGAFGWAPLAAANMISGGPAYPVATPGIRLQVNPAPGLSVLAAAFSGNTGGGDCDDDPQVCNRHGTNFSMSGGTLWMGEAQYAINQEKDAKGLPGVYKLGAWHETGNFADQRFGLDAGGALVPLADPSVVDVHNHRGDRGIYAIADQTVWRDGAGEQSANLFLRVGGAPDNRNLVSFYVDGGVGFTGLIEGRTNDILTLGVAYSRISNAAADADDDIRNIGGDFGFPVRDAETILELGYLAQIAPWWSVQPDLQYVVHPGGHVPDPDGTAALSNALVAGANLDQFLAQA